MNKKTSLAAAVLALALAPAPALAQDPPRTPTDARDPTTGQPRTPPADAASRAGQALRAADQRFLDEAHASGTKEIQLARLAQQRSADNDVRDLARQIERDHTQLNAQLEAAGARPAAQPHGPAVPTGPDRPMNPAQGAAPAAAATGQPDHVGALAGDPATRSLHTAQGAAFDRAYLDMVVAMHDQSVKKFESVVESAEHGPEVKTLARTALPSLRRHAAMASSLDDSLAQD